MADENENTPDEQVDAPVDEQVDAPVEQARHDVVAMLSLRADGTPDQTSGVVAFAEPDER